MSAAARPQPPSSWRFLLVAALAPLMLAMLIAWTGGEYARALATQDAAARSFGRERAQSLLLSAAREAEIAQQRYLLTGDPAFLDMVARARMVATRPGASAGTADPAWARLVDGAFASLDHAVALYRAGDAPAARREVAAGHGRAMDRLRDHVARASERERARAAGQSATFARHCAELYQVLIVTVALFGLVLLGITMALWRSRCDRYDAALATHEAAERYAAILASTSDTLLIVDPAGSIEMTNAAGRALLGYAPGELEHRALATVLPLDAAAGDFAAKVGLIDGQLLRDFLPDRVARRRDGSAVTVDVAIGVMPEMDGDHLVLSLRDASGRAQAERAKDELISTVSHELRTPLTSVVGSLALLRTGMESDWSPQARRLVDIADNNARRLIRLINDMLDIDRIESGQLAMARVPVDLRAITAQAALDAEGLAQGRGVTLVDVPAATPVMTLGDGERLLQVVTNLVSNAIQASESGGTVTLEACATGDHARVGVADRGPGIPAVLRPRLFDRFQSHRASGGTGLGLAISREIVRRLDGAIRFEDRAGGGTRFVFDLPLLRLPVVLHVDDDPERRATVAAALSGDAAVLPVASLSAARAALRAGVPSLVLLDMDVVDGDGAEPIPDLTDRHGDLLPLVILSEREVPAALALRAAAVLTKGRHGSEDVAAAVRRALPPAGGRA